MPSVTYNGQSLALDHRRIWIVGGGLQYARVPADQWADRLARVRQAGFNTVQTSCPWSLHEPRKGKYDFEGDADLGAFLDRCNEAELRAIVQVGPFVGHGFDAGGLPAHLADAPGARLREAVPEFMGPATKYIRKLAAQIAPRQATVGGAVILVQVEHDWTCTSSEQSAKYLGEIARILRESGIAVPMTNANGLWTDPDDTIVTWRGASNMLANVRQLHAVQPDAPRIVSELAPDSLAALDGDAGEDAADAPGVLRTVAEVLAGGGQPIIDPLHAGTSFGFSGGQRPGAIGATLCANPAPTAMLDESGMPTRSLAMVRRLATFASSFEHVFAGLDPHDQPVAIAPDGLASNALCVVPLRGAQGRVLFVFAGAKARKTDVLLDNGIRLPIDLGDQSVGWYAFGADLGGRGRLDYANVSPFTIVGRSTVVFEGPEKAPVLISIDGTPLQGQVPSGKKPLVVQHKGLTLVICNQSQIDVTHDDGSSVFVGLAGFQADGSPIAARGWPKCTRIDPDGKTSEVSIGGRKRGAGVAVEATMAPWRAAPVSAQIDGSSPRYASLDGPRSLVECGAPQGYGWYRIELKSTGTAKRLIHVPGGGDRLQFFLDGEPFGTFGGETAASFAPMEWKIGTGGHTLVVLAENAGRYWNGADLARPAGLTDHLYEVKAMRAVKPKILEAEPVDAFVLRGFIPGQVHGQLSDLQQARWEFTHARKTPIVVQVSGAEGSGTFVLNGTPIRYYAGRRGAPELRLVLDPASDAFKRGRNELRFAPDLGQQGAANEVAGATRLFECTASITGKAKWSFARWEPPAATALKAIAKSAFKSVAGRPCWWGSRFSIDAGDRPLAVDVAGLSRGHVFVNGRPLGRYVATQPGGKGGGPVPRLSLPASWLDEGGTGELLIFDELGAAPTGCRIATNVR